MQFPSILICFISGLLSFFSPCFLPIIPAYISYISGVDITEKDRKKVINHILLFTSGFSIVFILLGIGMSFLGSLLLPYRIWFNRIAGLIIIIFSLQIIGITKIKLLYKDIHLAIKTQKVSSLRSLLLGIIFACGWTPCIGPILGSILFYIATLNNLYYSIFLIFIYTLGLAIPFIILGIGWEYINTKLRHITKQSRKLEIITGVVILVLGIYLLIL